MFEVGRPRQFHYEPRFYDPEKEKLEALKSKYQTLRGETEQVSTEPTDAPDDAADLSYFESRLKDLDEEKRRRDTRLTWRDMFRKREMPQFHYQPRFSGQQSVAVETAATDIADDTAAATTEQGEALLNKYVPKHKIKIKRRYDISDIDYMKPMPASKIILYTGIVCILILGIFFL